MEGTKNFLQTAKVLIQILPHSMRTERISHITYTDVQCCPQSYKFTKKYESDLLLHYLCELHF